MTTASKITLARVVMIPVFMVLLLLGYNIPALIVFIVASCTDFVDGYIARHYNQVNRIIIRVQLTNWFQYPESLSRLHRFHSLEYP